MTYLQHEGTMAGLLTAIFECYERRLFPDAQIIRRTDEQQDIYARTIAVDTDAIKARRVWNGLCKKLSRDAQDQFYFTFLSEQSGTDTILLHYAQHAFGSEVNIEKDFGHPAVISVVKTARKVWREKHRMEAFVRFQKLKDGMFYAVIEPDHDVLPLILPHFKRRYADQPWLIYDARRKYGLHYDPQAESASEVQLEWQEDVDLKKPDSSIMDEREELYQLLWKDYFKSTGITARKNLKLHLQHVPARYWRYLIEKR